ncbi:tetratricopeptide repeat domain protein [Coleofasciculus chthonoplastes PCC 7420]|uniref:Tetratricopeptide repeat domain protein n=1 Tax=Coleofasciculus chthonoplastes PCC 7420 TaxID=118168 RepID=B4VX74_9CYAN|nr:CHAT domain-containing tetratricopeptide repeat protein [Coleofasciculus chthonoplastes]EDX73566.1 tetratricopeptide repeat domain protein [Coleofasciculus chthonoplastes PCC 7420]
MTPSEGQDINEYLAQQWFNQGCEYFQLGQFEQAIASYDKALQIKPDDHNAWYNRGTALLNIGEYEEAIASFEKALQFKPDSYEAWLNRGLALAKLGEYEEAITFFDKAIQIKPDSYEAWLNRGLALAKLGEYEEAIASYDKAIQIKPDKHETWHNWGLVLDDLGEYEEAIASYDKALQCKPDLHETWHNRGAALADLREYEKAIASYDKALQFKPDLHKTWHNRGKALGDLGEYEKAIVSYDKALQIKPDKHEAWLSRGLVLAELGEYEKAIASYDKALQFKPDFHDAWLNRGIAAGNSRHYNPEAATFLQFQFPDTSPILPNPTLTQRGYQGALLSFQEGLKHCLQDTHPEGWGRLHQYRGIVHYWQGKYQPNYRDYWRKARTEYHQALITLTPDAYPEQHLEVIQNLIRALLGLNQDTEAKEWRNQGLKVFQNLLNRQKSTFQKRRLLAKFLPFSQMRVDVLVEEGEPILALETAEMNKNLYLTWILDARNETTLSPDYRQIQSLTNPTTAIIYWHLSPNALTTFIIKHNSQNPIIIDAPLSPSGEVRGIKPLEDWIKIWDYSYQEYRKNPPQPPVQKKRSNIWLPPFEGGREGDRKGGRKGDKMDEQDLGQSWQDNLPKLLEELHHILNIPAILTQLNSESNANPSTQIQNLILIPHRDLHRFPLHALFPDTFTITYLPSAQIGLNLHNRGEIHPILPLLIDSPPHQNCKSLPNAVVESAAIAQLFPNSQRISGEQATKTTVTNALNGNYTIFHFSGHGTYEYETPQNSALLLNHQDKLTINDIRQLCLNSYYLVTLAACETALTGRETIEKDYVGLVSAFVYQGVSHVLSTLWIILDDISSSLFIVYFYCQLKKGKPPGVALTKTQKWLQNLTYQELALYYQEFEQQLPKEENTLRPKIRIELGKIRDMEPDKQQAKPFQHPYYWAAFTITGAPPDNP